MKTHLLLTRHHTWRCVEWKYSFTRSQPQHLM